MNLKNVYFDHHDLTIEPDQDGYNPFDEPGEEPEQCVVICHAPVVVFRGTPDECAGFIHESMTEQASREEGFLDAMAVKGE